MVTRKGRGGRKSLTQCTETRNHKELYIAEYHSVTLGVKNYRDNMHHHDVDH